MGKGVSAKRGNDNDTSVRDVQGNLTPTGAVDAIGGEKKEESLWSHHHGLNCCRCSPTMWMTIKLFLLITPALFGLCSILATWSSAIELKVQLTCAIIYTFYLGCFIALSCSCTVVDTIDCTERCQLNSYHYAVNPRILDLRWSLCTVIRYFWCPRACGDCGDYHTRVCDDCADCTDCSDCTSCTGCGRCCNICGACIICVRGNLEEHLASTKFSSARNQWELLHYFRRLTVVLNIFNWWCTLPAIVNFIYLRNLSSGLTLALFFLHLVFPTGEFIVATTPSTATAANGTTTATAATTANGSITASVAAMSSPASGGSVSRYSGNDGDHISLSI